MIEQGDTYGQTLICILLKQEEEARDATVTMTEDGGLVISPQGERSNEKWLSFKEEINNYEHSFIHQPLQMFEHYR